MVTRDYKQAYALAKFVIIAIPTNTEKIQKKYKDRKYFFHHNFYENRRLCTITYICPELLLDVVKKTEVKHRSFQIY